MNDENGRIDWDQWDNAKAKSDQRDESYRARLDFLKRGGQITRIHLPRKSDPLMTKCSFFRSGVGARQYWGLGYMPLPGHIVNEDHPMHISKAKWMRKPPQRVAPTPVA